MIDAVARFSTAWKEGLSPRWLTLCGNSGIGKTHCAGRLWEAIRGSDWFERNSGREQYFPKFLKWPDVINRLRNGDAWEWFRDIQLWPFVVIDDFGAERDPNGFSADNLYTMMSMREGQWTMFTTNLSTKQIATMDSRIISRLIRHSSVVCEIHAPDFNV